MTDPTHAPRSLAGPIHEWEIEAPPEADAGAIVLPDHLHIEGIAGQRYPLAAFADGDRWRVRFAGPAGSWLWRDGATSGGLNIAERAGRNWPPTPLTVSRDQRYLVDASGSPFFFFADTAWSIVWKGTPDQWEPYLDRRAAQGFTVLQVNLLPWRWELTDVEGNRPFVDGDPARPNAAYFRRFDQFLALAAERGLVTCLMLLWGGPIEELPASHFTTDQAVTFARYTVARFSAFPVLWSVSGDGPYAQELDKWEAVGAAVEESDPYGHATTNHLQPNMNWHFLFHGSAWHDFHMLQTGHRHGSLPDITDLPAAYYRRTPVKPVVNGEPWYEAHPSRDTIEYGPIFTPAEARYAFWVSLLSGATMGHTYGSQGIWNWKRPGDDESAMAGPQIGPPWHEALEHEGAQHCALAVALLRGLPWWRLQPAPERVQTIGLPADPYRRPAAAIVLGERWLVYLPDGGQVTLKGVAPGAWQARWFDPRTGAEQPIGAVEPDVARKWQAPTSPTAEDWVLALRRE